MNFETEAGRLVLIEGSTGRLTAAEVASFDGMNVTLTVDASDRLTEGKVIASFPDPEGLVRAEAVLIHGSHENEMVLEITQVHLRQQRRSWVRAKTQSSVALSVPGATFGTFKTVEGVTLDLSRGGARIQLNEKIRSGIVVTMMMKLNGQHITTMARVLESAPTGETRVEFLYVAGEGVDHIVSRVMSAALSNPASRKIARASGND